VHRQCGDRHFLGSSHCTHCPQQKEGVVEIARWLIKSTFWSYFPQRYRSCLSFSTSRATHGVINVLTCLFKCPMSEVCFVSVTRWASFCQKLVEETAVNKLRRRRHSWETSWHPHRGERHCSLDNKFPLKINTNIKWVHINKQNQLEDKNGKEDPNYKSKDTGTRHCHMLLVGGQMDSHHGGKWEKLAKLCLYLPFDLPISLPWIYLKYKEAYTKAD
jgi:hypothetical protein